MLKPGENLLIARTANGFMVTGTGTGDGNTSVTDAFVFENLRGHYSSDGLLAFIEKHFRQVDPKKEEE